jgi:hypothetical protein
VRWNHNLVLVRPYRQSRCKYNLSPLPRPHPFWVTKERQRFASGPSAKSFHAVEFVEGLNGCKIAAGIYLEHDHAGLRACYQCPVAARELICPLAELSEIPSCAFGIDRFGYSAADLGRRRQCLAASRITSLARNGKSADSNDVVENSEDVAIILENLVDGSFFDRYIRLLKSRRSHANLSRPCSLVLRV